jgi:hypothetical protein
MNNLRFVDDFRSRILTDKLCQRSKFYMEECKYSQKPLYELIETFQIEIKNIVEDHKLENL